MTAKSTPGPWEFCPATGKHGCETDDITAPLEGHAMFTRQVICRMDGYDRSIGEIEANARLIATAPELLAELKTCERLLMKLSSVAFDEKVQDFMPCGLIREVRVWVRGSKAQITIQKAEGRA